MADDQALWTAWAGGDRAAGQELYLRHCAVVSRVFVDKLKVSSVDDMVQKTFLKALEQAGQGEVRSVRAYLVAIARNLLLDAFRSAAGPRGRVDPMTQTLQDFEHSLAGAVARAREKHALLLALRRIPVATQLLLELFYWEGMSGEELAEAFAVPEGTIRSRLRRARVALREQMAEVSDDELESMSKRPDFAAWAQALRSSDD